MSAQSECELPFSPAFAARVMAHADGIRRRRRAWRFSVATAVFVGTATASVLVLVPERDAAPAPRARIAALPKPPVSIADSVSTDPLQYLFPDAAPVAQFADSYSEATYGRESKPGELLFADDTDEDAGDL
jgi:hypothetical protein